MDGGDGSKTTRMNLMLLNALKNGYDGTFSVLCRIPLHGTLSPRSPWKQNSRRWEGHPRAPGGCSVRQALGRRAGSLSLRKQRRWRQCLPHIISVYSIDMSKNDRNEVDEAFFSFSEKK